jgi:hypothetical protein
VIAWRPVPAAALRAELPEVHEVIAKAVTHAGACPNRRRPLRGLT